MRETENAFGRTKVSRRNFGRSIAGLGIAGVVGKTTFGLAQSDSTRECDVLIKGGTVIDPSQHLHAVLDVAVKNGKILEVSRDFPEGRAREGPPSLRRA